MDDSRFVNTLANKLLEDQDRKKVVELAKKIDDVLKGENGINVLCAIGLYLGSTAKILELREGNSCQIPAEQTIRVLSCIAYIYAEETKMKNVLS